MIVKEFILSHQAEIVGTLVTLIVLLILKFAATKTIRKVGKISDLNQVRTKLIIKYVSFGVSIIATVAIILIWGVNIKELGLIFSSIFAVIGVALFAQWSILSNVTAGIILFFSFPFKIGDRIKIFDKEMEYAGDYLIEDIKAYHIHLRKDNGELVTYPNNLMLQKAVSLINTYQNTHEGSEVL